MPSFGLVWEPERSTVLKRDIDHPMPSSVQRMPSEKPPDRFASPFPAPDCFR
jgi:hypothetical protein